VFDKVMFGAQLPYDAPSVHALLGAWGRQWWEEQLGLPEGQPSLTFPMLSRLAAYLLRCNPKIRAALRGTYSYVFLDEFQDTTESQWDLIKSVFSGSTSILSAVGDRKQRIMVWAGAKLDVFERFEEEFTASHATLLNNYRSVMDLVRMQHVLACAVEADTTECLPASPHDSAGACSILEFRDPEQEAAYLAGLVHDEIASGAAEPRDFAVLVRQRPDEMISGLKVRLNAKGIVMRNESTLQDLRTEPVADIVLFSLRLATKDRDADAWIGLSDALANVSGLDREADSADLERLVVAHKDCALAGLAVDGGILEVPRRIVDLLGVSRYRATYRQYANGDLLETTTTALGQALGVSLQTWGDAARIADDFAGVNVLPAMTIHKSKGLEFDTVIFLGLEDSQWWAFRNQPDEEKRAFFVAFSRAVRRVLFTYCDERSTKWGRRLQKRDEVDALYGILRQAEVQTIDLRAKKS
jgi:superfamily I DNA/RNA helicase